MIAWQQRPLQSFYPVIYLGDLVAKVREGAHVRNEAARIAVGVDLNRIKHARRSGCKPPRVRSAGRGLRAAREPQHRGRAHRLLRRATGLTLPIEATWADSIEQTCVVRLMRSAMRFVTYGQRKAVGAALKLIYQAAGATAGADRARGVRVHRARDSEPEFG